MTKEYKFKSGKLFSLYEILDAARGVIPEDEYWKHVDALIKADKEQANDKTK